MEHHLTERELIEYQFKLVSDMQIKEAAEHLQGCGECREHLEKLQRKFSALDLLRGEAQISEDLISRVIEQTGSAQSGVRTRIVWFKKYAWLSSAAAVLVVGVLLVATQLSKDGTKKLEVAKGPMPAVEIKLASKPEITSAERLDKDIVGKRTLAMAPKEKEADRYAAFGETAADTIPEQPPFAPASAIELVTLPRREEVQLTIYNSADLTLVRERRNLTLKKGWNWLQFMWANTLIDPTSLSLEPLAQADKIDIQQLVFPARLRELGRWLIRSEVSGQVPFEITYFTSGLSWRAFYMGTLSQDEKTMQLQGYVRVGNNSGEDYEKAETRLIVGKVHILDQIAELAKRQYPYNRPVEFDAYSGIRALEDKSERLGEKLLYSYAEKTFDTELRAKEIRKEGLSEYFLYTIEGTETIPDKWGKRLLSFDAADIEVESLYKYDEQRWGNQTIRFVKFANDEDHNLGETPIPNGTVKIYGQTDEQGYLSYVGGTNIKYIPVDEEVELNLGPARLVSVEPKLMDFKTDNYIFDNRGNVAGWDEIRTWKIEITNTRTLPIEIEITRGFSTAYWTIRTDIAYEKYDATHARIKLNLEPRKKQVFEYTVTTCHGTREETFAEKQ
ncbi:MAG TPA: DUF4139 domain-containing protein [Sedimentisphaerales bacterium]|nr:DUF4139 domain-containing protein [Sedimentisphaerales bacterium]